MSWPSKYLYHVQYKSDDRWKTVGEYETEPEAHSRYSGFAQTTRDPIRIVKGFIHTPPTSYVGGQPKFLEQEVLQFRPALEN